jgi:hypothetical protein
MKFAPLAVLAVLVTAGATEAKITQITIERTQRFADGQAFGAVGAYEVVAGTAKGELDPKDRRNRVIVNLDRAPVNGRGMVEYETPFLMLRPADASRGNHKIIYDVTNRGRKFLLPWLMDAPAPAGAINDPKDAKDAGNGLFFRQGWIMAWSAWDPDAPTANNGMAMKVPVATNGGQPIVRVIRDELVSATRGPALDSFRLSYEVASLDPAQAALTVRRKAAFAPVAIPASGWAYADARTIRLLPEGTKPEPGALYELHYQAKNPKVLGIGYAATRDLISFLRYEKQDSAGTANPAGAGIKSAVAIGISQSGRYLRDHVSQGFNQDEARRKVFDGVLAHISGVGRVFHNAEFGQPFRTNTQHEDHTYPENEFPFSAANLKDPVTGKSGSLFRHDGFDPLLIETNTSTEYWQKGASLLHTDPLGRRDVALPRNARVFMIAGTQHGGRFGLTAAPGPCVNPRNPHSAGPALRALLVALDEWVSTGRAPPASRVPHLKDGTLVAPDRTGFPAIPGAVAVREVNEVAPFGDWVRPAPDRSRAYRPLVAKVDADGNEVAGIRLPDIAVPVATYTGWNQYKPPFPEGEICDRDGSYLALAKTRAEREARGDPRPALAERYPSQAAYVGQVEKSVGELVKARLLLREDGDNFIAQAKARNLLAP